MTVCTIHDQAPAHSGTTFWSRLRKAWSQSRPGRAAILDPRDLSGHLQRDMGFQDGNAVYDRPSDFDGALDDDLRPSAAPAPSSRL
jgi:hypothetical protein